MLTWYFCIAQILDIITIHLQATGQHKNKAGFTHSPVYDPFASTHMVNTQLLCVQNVHAYKISNIFAGFCMNSHLLNFSRKLMRRKYSTFTVVTF